MITPAREDRTAEWRRQVSCPGVVRVTGLKRHKLRWYRGNFALYIL